VTRLTRRLAEGRDIFDEHFSPAFLARRRIETAHWTGEMKERREAVPDDLRYLADLTLTPNSDGVEVQATIWPASPPRKRASSTVYDPFVERHGLIRYERAPSWLGRVDHDARRSLGAERSTYSWRHSAGPWEYLPNESFVDWRIRAREVIECRSEPPALVDLIRTISLHPLLYGGNGRLTVDYQKL
jgi:hypothetical protein